MKNNQFFSKSIFSFICLCTFYCATSLAQQDTLSDFSYQINRVQKYVSISPVELENANTLSDLYHHYKSEWVKEYKYVKMIATVNDRDEVVTTDNDQVTQEQKELLNSIDMGSEVRVIVSYLPDNNLNNNEVREMDFAFRIDPINEAKYTNGKEKLDLYIKENILSKVTVKDVPQYQVAAVKFTVNEEGHIVDANIESASKTPEADELLLKTICDMPSWKSAQYADGTKTKQEFVLTVGDHYSCTMNTLDIKSVVPPSIQSK